MLYQDGKGVMETVKQNTTDKEDAAAYREIQQNMKQEKAINVGEEQGRNKLLQEIQARADAEAAANNAFMSQSPYAVNARQGQEVPTPSYGSSIKNAISKLISGRSNNETGLSESLANVPAVALSEQAEYQSQQDMAAQEADRLLNRGVR